MSRASDRAAQGGDDYRITDAGWGGPGYRSTGAEGAVSKNLFRNSKHDAETLKAVKAGDAQRGEDANETGKYTSGGTIMLYEFNRLKNTSAMEVTTPGGIKLFVSYDTVVGFYSPVLADKDAAIHAEYTENNLPEHIRMGKSDGMVLPEAQWGYRWRFNEWGVTTAKHMNNWGSEKEYRLAKEQFGRIFDKVFADMTGKLNHNVRAATLQAQAPVYEAMEAIEDLYQGNTNDPKTEIAAARVALAKAIEVFEEQRSS